MVLLQAGMYPKNYVLGMKGKTNIPCFVCGSCNLYRMRIIRLVEEKQFVLHICSRNLCARSVTGFDVTFVKKIRSNAVEPVSCSRCNRDARGGIFASEGLFTKVNLCELCLLDAVRDAVERHKRIVLQGGID